MSNTRNQSERPTADETQEAGGPLQPLTEATDPTLPVASIDNRLMRRLITEIAALRAEVAEMNFRQRNEQLVAGGSGAREVSHGGQRRRNRRRQWEGANYYFYFQ